MSALIFPASLPSGAPRQSWHNTRRAADFRPMIFSAKQWIGLRKQNQSVHRATTMHCCAGIRALESLSETSWFRAKKKSQSNFRWNRRIGCLPVGLSIVLQQAGSLPAESGKLPDLRHNRAAASRARACGTAKAMIAGHDLAIFQRFRIDVPKKHRLAFAIAGPLHVELLIEIAIVNFAPPADTDRVATHQTIYRLRIKCADEQFHVLF